MSEGFLIAFEGGDRCGKTTQLQKLYEYLTAKGRDVVQLKHPDRGTVIGHIIDSFLRKQIRLSNEVATLLLTANLWENHAAIVSQLSENRIVLIDRYIDTNMAYSQLRGITKERLAAMMVGIRKPDLVVYLRSCEKVFERADFGMERYDSKSMQMSVRSNFDAIFEDKSRTSGVLILDSAEDIDGIFGRIKSKLEELGYVE